MAFDESDLERKVSAMRRLGATSARFDTETGEVEYIDLAPEVPPQSDTRQTDVDLAKQRQEAYERELTTRLAAVGGPVRVAR